ncbi:MAG: molybdopterin-dependent oxidoreductase, partial [Acidimicrobiales bacterium]
MTSFDCNGATVSVGGHPHLLAALRDELGLIAAKDGCSPSGQCGCCTILLDGKARVACQVPLEKVEGRSVTTLEGLPTAERDRFAAAFGATGAIQCGFCTPGIVMRTKALVDKHGSDLTREQAARHLGAHLCRCTGYLKILDAVELLASGAEGAGDTHLGPGRGIGARGARYQAGELTLGDKLFVDDMRVPDMLHGAVRLADHARADVVRIRTDRAEAVPGVARVLTAADVIGERRIGIIHRDWPVFIPEGGRTSYLGDVLALVVADHRETARAAARLIEIDYEVLDPITDPAEAVADGAPDAVWGLDGNFLSVSRYRRGPDLDDALARSVHVVDEHFVTQRVEQAFLEPESTLAVPTEAGPDGSGVAGLHVYSGGQGVWDDRDQIASVLGVERSRVQVELVDNGGAFGGKEDCSNQAQTALAAWLLRRPVQTTFSRDESL